MVAHLWHSDDRKQVDGFTQALALIRRASLCLVNRWHPDSEQCIGTVISAGHPGVECAARWHNYSQRPSDCLGFRRVVRPVRSLSLGLDGRRLLRTVSGASAKALVH
jgi:hypothetical protein